MSEPMIERRMLNPAYLVAVFASVLYWTWMFGFYWTGFSDRLVHPLEGLLLRGAALFASALTLLVLVLASRRTADFLSRGTLAVALPGLLGAVAPACSLASELGGVALPFGALAAAWACSGCGIALVLLGVGRLMRGLSSDGMIMLLALTLAISCLACLYLLKVPTLLLCGFMVLAPACCGLLCWRQRDAASAEAGDTVTAPEARSAKREYRHLLMQQFVFSSLFSLGQFINLSLATDGGFSFFDYFGLGLLLSCVLFLTYGALLNRLIKVGQLQTVLVFLVSVATVFLVLAADHYLFRAVCCTLLCFGFTSFDLLSICQLARLVTLRKMPFVRAFAGGRLANAGGMALGCLTVVLALSLAGFDVSAVHFEYVFCFAMFLLIGYFAFALRSHAGFADELAAPDAAERLAEVNDSRQQACLALWGRYGLSPREMDVADLLSRGRSVNYICDALYISPSTVKTHSSHIYRKMGIHRQQELISMVETEIDSRCYGIDENT